MRVKIAVLNDYQKVALKMADWTLISTKHRIDVYNDHVSALEPLVQYVGLFSYCEIKRPVVARPGAPLCVERQLSPNCNNPILNKQIINQHQHASLNERTQQTRRTYR